MRTGAWRSRHCQFLNISAAHALAGTSLVKTRAAVGRYRYVLKCDIRKYFPLIDNGTLKDLLARVVKCKPTIDLAARMIDGSNEQKKVLGWSSSQFGHQPRDA